MSTIMNETAIDHLLDHGVEAVYPTRDALKARLMSGKPMRLYVGFDPTSPHLHIGHANQLRKLREFQQLGHEVIMLIGSFTAMIGDPTDKSAARTQLSAAQVMQNAKTYKKQASKILSFIGKNPVRLKFNHKWLAKMNFADVVQLCSHSTVQQMLERDMFERRIEENKPVFIHEFLYPLMQGYDSVAMDVDGELGGSDQTFNMLAGRTLMKEMRHKEKFVVALRLLTNAEGRKMSKSEGGFIALDDSPEDMFGKLMAMDDSMILPYFELATDVSHEEIAGIKIALEQGANPRDLKIRLASKIVEMYHSPKTAVKAQEHFVSVFSNKETPDEVAEVRLADETTLIDALMLAKLVSSKGEGRRLVEQGGVKVGGVVATDAMMKIVGTKEGLLVQKGKRHFVKYVR